MKLADTLDPLPTDPYERLLELHRQWGEVTEKTYKVMTSIYPDYAEVMDNLMLQLARAERDTGAHTVQGEA